ncbi:MAG: RNA pseudouridine synthase, partial [Bdellovibrionaceae bacterium]|nr:RNA pseudouridine synthase [Pseudobdellovibrionaceae bacterium]
MESSPFIFGNKPYGVATHQTDPHQYSYKEWLTQNIKKKLYPSYPLDKDATGAVIFPTTDNSAEQFAQELSKNCVEQKYIFITDKAPPQKQWINKNPINLPTSNKSLPAETHFLVLKEEMGFFVLSAQTKTGLTHQIRIHAAESGVPLLGDRKYGGSTYAQFFLHLQSLSAPELHLQNSVEPPLIFKNLQLLKKPLLVQWLMSVDRRQRLYPDIHSSAYRWIHEEGTPLRLDVLGNKGCAGWWRDTPPNSNELDYLKELFSLLDIKEWRLMHYSGQRLQDKP